LSPGVEFDGVLAMDNLTLIVALIFLAAALLIYAVYWVFVFNRREQRILNRRLVLAKDLSSPSVVLETLRLERGFSNSDNQSLRQISDWLTQTGTRVQRKTLSLAFVVAYLVCVLLMSAVIGVGFTSLAGALVLSVVVVIAFLSLLRRRRIFTFTDQLPDAIDIITRGVRVGLPFSSAIGLVAREMPDPVGTEFGMLGDEITFGLDLNSALHNLYRRVGQDDLLFLTITVSIQSQTGGNLGEVLSRLSKLMRSRAKMRLKIKSLSAEGRASAFALTIFPFLLFAVINLLAPSYYGVLHGSPILGPAIFLGLFLLVTGNLIMYRMVNFKY
jgi:tight adherence protein B